MIDKERIDVDENDLEDFGEFVEYYGLDDEDAEEVQELDFDN